MWSLTTVAGAMLLFNLLTHAIGGVAMIGKTTVEAGASAAGQAGGVANALGVNADDLLAPINRRLQEEGKPTVSAAQVEAASKDVIQKSIRQGHVDRDSLVASIAQHTNLSRQDSEQLATQVENKIGMTGARASNAATSLQGGALRAAESTGKAFWGVFGAMLVGMIAAVLGAMLGGGPNRQRTLPPRGGTTREERVRGGTFAQRHSHT
jgi:hypothetical protein